MNILLLKGYNNYFNRIVKREETISAYKSAVVDGNTLNYYELANANFNPNDGVVTELVIGKGDLKWDDKSTRFSQGDREGRYNPDYAVVYDMEPSVGTTSIEIIYSRWFVTECERTRGGQYRIALKRDVLADFNEEIMNSPCFVEKGTISDVNNPLLLNAEGMRFNQIKNSEDFIKDNTKVAWLVGYVKKDIDSNDLQNVNPINYTSPEASASLPDAEDFAWEECIEYFDTNGQAVNQNHKDCFYFYNTDVSFRTWYDPKAFRFLQGNVRTKFTENFQMLYNSTDFPNEDWGGLNSCAFDIVGKASDDEAKAIARRIFELTRDDEDCRNKFNTMIAYGKTSQFSADTVLINEDIFKYNGKQVIKDNKVYRLEVSVGENTTSTKYFTGNDSGATNWMTTIGSKITNCAYNSDNQSRNKVRLDFRGKSFSIIAREVLLEQTISFNFPISADRNNCSDATYDIFAMPIDPKALGLSVTSDDVIVLYGDASEGQFMDVSAKSEMQLAIATLLSTKLGANSGGALNYDLQLLPYCPIEDLDVYFENTIYGPTYGKTVIDVSNMPNTDCTLIYNNASEPEVMGVIFYPKKANFSKLIDFVVPNESIHYEIQEVIDPIFTYNNQEHDGLPVWRFANFPYKVTDGVWDLNIDEAILPDIIVEAEYKLLTVSSGLESPQILFTSNDMPLNPTPSQQVTVEGTLGVKAHWILPDRPIDVKIKNECDMYRLASPNFMSMYEFKKTKLRNGLKSFNIDCTYKPFTPYIKINPNYDDSLYAIQDFNDSMGLILNGDFSIPMLSDAWINYELQNRNYQAIFNRSIENLDINQQIAKEQQQFQGIVGAITGGVVGGGSGALAGSKAGPYGAIAGAVVGGLGGATAGAIGYNLDRAWLERQQQEIRSFAIDNFNYQLGNVQALNPTITKTTPLTYNNKVWPILEYYTCTDKEKELLEQKIRYDGMTIMAIDTLNAYASNGGKLKGKMIRLETLKDDSHVADAIYQEVDKGFYTQGE